MRVALALLGLVGLAYGGLPPRVFNNFQDHFRQFMEISDALEGGHWRRQVAAYAKFAEYSKSMDYLVGVDFRKIVADLKRVPEFKAVEEFLDDLTIDIDYYVDNLQTIIGKMHKMEWNRADTEHMRVRRHPMTGTTMTTFIADTISLLPIRQLRALFNQRIAENRLFKNAVEGLRSDEFKTLYRALWENEDFKKVADELKEHDFDLKQVFEQFVVSLLGQNIPVRLTFQIHFDEFLEIISALEGPHWVRQVVAYKGFPEFKASLKSLANTDITQMYQDLMVQSPVFKKADAYLKKHDIFVAYYIDRLELITDHFNLHDEAPFVKEIESAEAPSRVRRHPMTGTTMHTFIVDTISLLPIRQLRVLFDKLMATSDDFKGTVNALKTDEWKKLYADLWKDETFLKKVNILKNDCNFDPQFVFEQLAPALFGQNTPVYTSFQMQFDEFLDIIIENAGDEFLSKVKAYKKHDHFKSTLDTLANTVFIQFYQDLRKINIFKEYDEYLKKNDIFVAYYIDRFNELARRLNTNVTQVGEIEAQTQSAYTSHSMQSFLDDVVNMLPQTELNNLYEEKMANNEVFKKAVESLRSEQGKKYYNDFMANKTFSRIVQAFAEHGFDIKYVFETLVPALYGQ